MNIYFNMCLCGLQKDSNITSFFQRISEICLYTHILHFLCIPSPGIVYAPTFTHLFSSSISIPHTAAFLPLHPSSAVQHSLAQHPFSHLIIKLHLTLASYLYSSAHFNLTSALHTCWLLTSASYLYPQHPVYEYLIISSPSLFTSAPLLPSFHTFPQSNCYYIIFNLKFSFVL